MKKLLIGLLALGSMSAFAKDTLELEKVIKQLKSQLDDLQSIYVSDGRTADSYMDLLEKYHMVNASDSKAPTKRDVALLKECFKAVENSKYSAKLSNLRSVTLHNYRYQIAYVNKEKANIVIYGQTTKQSCYDEIITKL